MAGEIKKGIQRAFSFFGKGGVAKGKQATTRMYEHQRERLARFDVRDNKR